MTLQPTTLEQQAELLLQRVESLGKRIVLAESCTGGLAASAIARTPGASNSFCGSAVVYREATKHSWLGVSSDELAAHGAVSEPIARQMALGALFHTSEADYSASITGHVGPDAPADLDGVAHIAVALREGDQLSVARHQQIQLAASDRITRQTEAAEMMLRLLGECVAASE
jgi:PncC family amidohydrolase